jgi:hypothetical protein
MYKEESMAFIADALAVILTAILLALLIVNLIPWAFKKVRRKPAPVILITKDCKPTETPITEAPQSEGDVHESQRQP